MKLYVFSSVRFRKLRTTIEKCRNMQRNSIELSLMKVPSEKNEQQAIISSSFWMIELRSKQFNSKVDFQLNHIPDPFLVVLLTAKVMLWRTMKMWFLLFSSRKKREVKIFIYLRIYFGIFSIFSFCIYLLVEFSSWILFWIWLTKKNNLLKKFCHFYSKIFDT